MPFRNNRPDLGIRRLLRSIGAKLAVLAASVPVVDAVAVAQQANTIGNVVLRNSPEAGAAVSSSVASWLGILLNSLQSYIAYSNLKIMESSNTTERNREDALRQALEADDLKTLITEVLKVSPGLTSGGSQVATVVLNETRKKVDKLQDVASMLDEGCASREAVERAEQELRKACEHLNDQLQIRPRQE